MQQVSLVFPVLDFIEDSYYCHVDISLHLYIVVNVLHAYQTAGRSSGECELPAGAVDGAAQIYRQSSRVLHRGVRSQTKRGDR